MVRKLMFGVITIVIVVSIVGILGFPFFAGLSGNVAPSRANQWHVGKGIQYDPIMQYDITTNNTKFSAKIEFLSATKSQNQTLYVEINDPKNNLRVNQTVPINAAYDFTDVSDTAKPYFDVLDSTIFSIRDLALEDKYLVKGAVWGYEYIGEAQEEITVTDYNKTSFAFGTANAYVVSYKEENKENKFWIVDNLPLPVKAEVYDISGNLLYSYELKSLIDPLSSGF